MGRRRPFGVTILGLYIIVFAMLALLISLNHLQGWDIYTPDGSISGMSSLALGIIYLFIGLSRLGVGIGVLNLKRAAWKGAFIIISIGIFFDLIYGYTFGVILGVIALLYLMMMKNHFRYR